MKTEIHPEYKTAGVTCVCGNQFTTGSTKNAIRVEVCEKCHPFYTGKQKHATLDDRVDKFNKKYKLK